MNSEITKAFGAVLEDIVPVKKGADNPYFKSNYVSLNQVLELLLPLLRKHGLVISQPPGVATKEGYFAITTIILHKETGEVMEFPMEIPIKERNPQAAGSSYSYARRYSLVGIFNIPAVDDDAESAMFRKVTTANGDEYVQTDNGMQRTEESNQLVTEKLKAFREFRKNNKISPKEAIAITGYDLRNVMSLDEADDAYDKLQDFVLRRESGNLSDSEIQMLSV